MSNPTKLSPKEKIQYAMDLEADGENGAFYLSNQFNIFQLRDLRDDALSDGDFESEDIISRAMTNRKVHGYSVIR